MMEYAFELEGYKGGRGRYECPQCRHKSEFTRYINKKTGEYVNKLCGICNRKEKCGYHSPPNNYIPKYNVSGVSSVSSVSDVSTVSNNNTVSNDTFDTVNTDKHTNTLDTDNTFDTVSYNDISKTLNPDIAFKQNNFVKYLMKLFGDSLTIHLINKFKIGTGKNNYTIFYQIDNNNLIRTGKRILYDSDTGKRKGDITFIHKKIDINYNLKQCLFGLNNLQDGNKEVCIFESEKTAILMSVFFPESICLATGGVGLLNAERFKILKEKKCFPIILYPDKSQFDNWKERAKRISSELGIKINVSKSLEKYTETKGNDLADYIETDKEYNWALSQDKYPVFWDFPF